MDNNKKRCLLSYFHKRYEIKLKFDNNISNIILKRFYYNIQNISGKCIRTHNIMVATVGMTRCLL